MADVAILVCLTVAVTAQALLVYLKSKGAEVDA